MKLREVFTENKETDNHKHGTFAAFYLEESCAKKLHKWCMNKELECMPSDDLHCTLIHSKKPVRKFEEFNNIKVKATAKIKEWKKLGDYLVLDLDFPEAAKLNELMLKSGAVSDYPSFIAHTSIVKEYTKDKLPEELPDFDLEFNKVKVTGVDPER